MSDAIARLSAALEGRYALERELGVGGTGTVGFLYYVMPHVQGDLRAHGQRIRGYPARSETIE